MVIKSKKKKDRYYSRLMKRQTWGEFKKEGKESTFMIDFPGEFLIVEIQKIIRGIESAGYVNIGMDKDSKKEVFMKESFRRKWEKLQRMEECASQPQF